MLPALVLPAGMLAIVLLALDARTFPGLRLVQHCPLVPGDDAVGLGPRFHAGDPVLPALQLQRLVPGQTAPGDALLDALLLAELLVIDARRALTGQGKTADRQGQGDDEKGTDGFHDEIGRAHV